MIWGDFKETKFDKNTKSCQGNTVLTLLLSFTIIMIVQSGLSVLSLISSGLFSYCKTSKVVVFTSYALSRLSTCIVGLSYTSMLVLNIVMTVMLYSKGCSTTSPALLERLQPFIITQFVLLPLSICCLTCCVTCTANLSVMGLKEKPTSLKQTNQSEYKKSLLNKTENTTEYEMM